MERGLGNESFAWLSRFTRALHAVQETADLARFSDALLKGAVDVSGADHDLHLCADNLCREHARYRGESCGIHPFELARCHPKAGGAVRGGGDVLRAAEGAPDRVGHRHGIHRYPTPRHPSPGGW